MRDDAKCDRRYRRLKVPVRYRYWVDSIWLQDAEATPGAPATRLMPALKCDLVIRYGDPFIHHTDCGDIISPAVAWHGIRTRVREVSATGRTGLMIVNFKPWATPALLGIAAHELSNRGAGLDSLWAPSQAETIGDAIASAPDDEGRLCALVDHVLSRLPDASDDRRLLRLTQNARLTRGYAGQARTLRRHFKHYIGISPKQYAKLIRFQLAANDLRTGRRCADAALRAGYYDQSHLGADFRSMLGQSPRQFASVTRTRLARSFQRASSESLFQVAYV